MRGLMWTKKTYLMFSFSRYKLLLFYHCCQGLTKKHCTGHFIITRTPVSPRYFPDFVKPGWVMLLKRVWSIRMHWSYASGSREKAYYYLPHGHEIAKLEVYIVFKKATYIKKLIFANEKLKLVLHGDNGPKWFAEFDQALSYVRYIIFQLMPLLPQLISHAFEVVSDNSMCTSVVVAPPLLLGNLEHHMKIILLWFIVHKTMTKLSIHAAYLIMSLRLSIEILNIRKS